MSSSTDSFNKSIPGCEHSNALSNFDSAILDKNEKYVPCDWQYKHDHLFNFGEIPHEYRTANENISAALLARSIIKVIESLKNTEIDSAKLTEFKTQLRSLASFCNSKFMNDFSIVVVDISVGNTNFEIKSWYSHNLNLTNIYEFIINTFEELEINSYNIHVETSNRCIDAMCVLVNYINAVVLSRTDNYLELQEKKLDELQSSKSVETSIQLLNGDDFYG